MEEQHLSGTVADLWHILLFQLRIIVLSFTILSYGHGFNIMAMHLILREWIQYYILGFNIMYTN